MTHIIAELNKLPVSVMTHKKFMEILVENGATVKVLRTFMRRYRDGLYACIHAKGGYIETMYGRITIRKNNRYIRRIVLRKGGQK
jgi:hypothetical protein